MLKKYAIISIVLFAICAMLMLSGALAEGYPQSAHPYANNSDITWTYTHPDPTPFLRVTFSSSTEFQNNYDFLYITDESGTEQAYTNTQLQGKTLTLEGDSFTLRLVTNNVVTRYGFAITNISASDRYIVDSGSCGTGVTWDLDIDGTLTLSGNGKTGDYSNSYSRKAPWKSYRSSIKNIVVEPGVTYIGDYSFYQCTNLKTVNLPDGLSGVGDYAFYQCSGLRDVYAESLAGWIGISFGSFESTPMSHAVNLYIDGEIIEDVVVPEGTTAIGDSAFEGCRSVKTVKLPNSITSIGKYAFQYTSLKSINLPYGIKTIGNAAFYGCYSLKNIDLPDSITSIGRSAFSRSGLVKITIPYGVKTIEGGSFASCTSLKNVVIPSSVQTIGVCAFMNCSSLENISLPTWISTIKDSTFYGCSSLTSISLPGDITSIEDDAFRYCSSLSKVFLLENVAPKFDFPSYFSASTVTIYCYPFSNPARWAEEHGYRCVYVEQGVPDTITLTSGDIAMVMDDTFSIEAFAFPMNVSKYNFSWKSSNPEVATVKNGTITALSGGTTVISASYNGRSAGILVSVRGLKKLTLPANIHTIDAEAFTGVDIEKAVIPSGCESIGARAFADCKVLATVVMPDSVTHIADDAFTGCENVSFVCASENAAAVYAAEHGIPFSIAQ